MLKSKIELFLSRFIKLQRETNNSPANLKWLPEEKTYIYGLCYELNSSFKEVSRYFLMKRTKHSIVPNIFFSKWDDYRKNWLQPVAEAAEVEDERNLQEIIEYLGESKRIVEEEMILKKHYAEWRRVFEDALLSKGMQPEDVYKEKGTPEEYYQYWLESLARDHMIYPICFDLIFWDEIATKGGFDPIVDNPAEINITIPATGNPVSGFDPIVDNPAEIMDELYSYLQGFLANDFFDGVINYKHLNSWDFFKDIIGIDYLTIYRRWNAAPELFISTHMLSKNITAIVELYNEAVRAYVFGLTEASVAMCRALLEHVLKKYYHISGDDLSRIISEAERRYVKLRGLDLHTKREIANKVLHDYGNRVQETEKAAFDFLQAIRHLVTLIPTP